MTPADETRAKHRLLWLQAALIVLAGWFVFSPAFHGDWLWDDFEIRENPTLRDLSGLGKVWFAPATPDYYPLETSVLWGEWHLWHENLLGYHLTTTALQLLDAFLLWHVLKKLGLRLAYLGGLLFVVHPMMVGSVAWVAELKNTLSLAFLLMAMSAHIDYDEGRRKHLLALPLFLAAMLCKSSVVMFPCVLLLYAWWRRGRIRWADLRATAGFFAISLVLGLVTVSFQKNRAISNWRLPHETLVSRLAGAGMAIKFYFLKCILPLELMPIYPRFPANPSLAASLLPWIILAAVIAWLWARRAGFGRHALFGLGFFMLNLVPVLGFVPMAFLHIAPVADHLAYLPLTGLIGLGAAGLGAGLDRLSPSPRIVVIGAVAALCALLALEGHRYARIYINQETMWAYNLQRNSTSPAVYINMAFIQHQDGDLAAAAENYRKAILLNPEDPEPEEELANVLVEENDPAEAASHYQNAIAHYERALQIDPTLLGTRRGFAKLLAKAGRPAAAIPQYEQILRREPQDPEIENDLGKALAEEGRETEAVAHYKKALRFDPDYAEAENSLGFAIASGEGRLHEGETHLERALKLNPDFAEAHSNLGFVLARMGQPQEAIVQFEKALQLKPGLAEARNNLGFVLAGIGRRPEAIAQFEKALRLRPDDAKAHYNLSLILEASGRTREAIAHLQRSLALDPGFAAARAELNRLNILQIAAGSEP